MTTVEYCVNVYPDNMLNVDRPTVSTRPLQHESVSMLDIDFSKISLNPRSPTNGKPVNNFLPAEAEESTSKLSKRTYGNSDIPYKYINTNNNQIPDDGPSSYTPQTPPNSHSQIQSDLPVTLENQLDSNESLPSEENSIKIPVPVFDTSIDSSFSSTSTHKSEELAVTTGQTLNSLDQPQPEQALSPPYIQANSPELYSPVQNTGSSKIDQICPGQTDESYNDFLKDFVIIEKVKNFTSKEQLMELDNEGDSLLHCSIFDQSINRIKCIIYQSKELQCLEDVLNQPNKDNKCPIWLAVISKSFQIVKTLLEEIPSLDVTKYHSSRKGLLHVLHLTLFGKSFDIFQLLIDTRKFNVNQPTSEGDSLLMLVFTKHHSRKCQTEDDAINLSIRFFKKLIENGADLSYKDNRNNKPTFHYLMETRCLSLINAVFEEILRKTWMLNGKELPGFSFLEKLLNDTDSLGNSSLHRVAGFSNNNMFTVGSHIKLVKFLINCRADLEQKNNIGHSPSFYAVNNELKRAMKRRKESNSTSNNLVNR